MVDLNEVAAFARVVREGSFTRAADALGLPKSTLSERVARLEDRLGVRLLERTTRSVHPTAAGSAYYERVARVVDELALASAAVTESHRAVRGLVRIGSSILAARVFLLRAIDEFAVRHPEVDIDLVTADRRMNLAEENLDLALVVFEPNDRSLVVRRLATAERLCVAAPSYLAAHGIPQKPDDLRRHACIVTGGMVHATRQATWSFTLGQRTEEVSVRARFVMGSVELVAQAARDGVGIGIAPSLTCAEDVASGHLVRVLADYSAGSTELLLVHPRTKNLPNRVRLLADHIVERFRVAPALPGIFKPQPEKAVRPRPKGRRSPS